MQLEVGAILDGTVTGITKFGAFVSLAEGKSGLVHISEVANTFVTDVNDYLKVGQAVKVRVLAITPDGKINLSIKRAVEAPPQQHSERRASRPQRSAQSPRQNAQHGQVHGPTNDASFEDRLKQFMQESDSRIAGNRLYSDRNRGRRRGK